MSLYKDTVTPHWRTDELKKELQEANEKIAQLEAEQRRMQGKMERVLMSLRAKGMLL